MKKLILSAAIMLASVGAYAQHAVGSINLQPKIGMNVAMLTDADKADPRIGLAAGLEAEYQATDLLSISAGVMYSMQGNKYSKEVLGTKFTTTNKFDYVNIPIMANVYVVPGLAVKLGIQPGFLVSDKATSKVDTGSDKVNKLLNKNLPEGKLGAKSFDFSIPVGISYEYANFQLDARYNFGVTKVFDVEGSKAKNSVFQITLGYKFAL